MKNDLDDFFAAVANEYPSIEHGGKTFRVRLIAPDDRQKAIAQMKIDCEREMASDSRDDEKPLSEEQIEKGLQVLSGGDEATIRLVDLDDLKTEKDFGRCVFRMSYLADYCYAKSLMREDGTEFDLKDLFRLAKLINTNPAFKKKIGDAHDVLRNAGIELPNGQALPKGQKKRGK